MDKAGAGLPTVSEPGSIAAGFAAAGAGSA
jgi:hypothetical protein